MNEEQIQTQLQQNINKDSSDNITAPSNDEAQRTLNGIRLMEFFDISSFQKNNPDMQQMLSDIMQWGIEKSGSNDFNDIVMSIQHQLTMMGVNFRENKVNLLYKYIKLERVKNSIDAQIGGLYD